MNGFNINEGSVLSQYAQARQLEIERLLRQYRAPSASETGDMIRQIQGLVSRQQLATQPQTEPFMFSAAEVGELGMAIQEGWQLKFTPFNGGYKSSLITPQKWEITEDDLYISPTGEEYSRADLMTLLQMPVPGLAPETLLPTTAQELTEQGQEVYQKYRTEGGQLGVADWLDLLENQRLETEEVFGRVFPEEDIQEVMDYIATDPKGFIADIREIGLTEDTEALLRTLEFEDEQGNLRHLTDLEIQDFFGMQLPEPIRKFQEEFYEKLAAGELTPWEYRAPAEAVYEAEGWFKDAFVDALWPGLVTFRDNTLMAITSIVPSLLAQVTPPPSVQRTLASFVPWGFVPQTIAWNIAGQERTPEQQVRYEEIQTSALGWFNFYRVKMDNFERQNPQFIPKPEYIQDPTEHPEILLDPGYWVYTISSSLTYTLATMSTIVVGTAVGGPAVGLGGGLMMAGGAESGGMVRELMAKGVPFDEAVKWGGLYGLFAGTIEVASDLPFLGIVFSPMKGAAKPFLTAMRKTFTNWVARRIAIGVALSLTEGIEEGLTQIGHNAILKYYDDTQSIWEGVGHAFVQGAVAASPFAGIGGYASFRTFRDTLSPEMQGQYDNQIKEFRKLGLTEWEAQIQAANWLARTPEGEAALTAALEAAKQEYLETVERQPGQFVPGLAESILQELDVAEKVTERVTPRVEIEGIVADLNLLREEKVWIDTMKTKGASVVHMQSGETATIVSPPEDFTSGNYEQRAMQVKWGDGSEMVMDSAEFAPSALQKHIAEITHGKPIPEFPTAEARPKLSELQTGKPYTATVYRGEKEEGKPVDEGLFGKGTYYTTNKAYAETYDGKEVTTVNLQNPFAIKTHEEAEAFWNETTRPARQEAITEGKTPQEADELAAQAATAWLKERGHDGLIARNIIAPGDEIVVFEPKKAIGKPEVAPAVPQAAPGMPEAGVQPSMLGEVPSKEVRPQPTGKLVQSRLDDYLRLREYNEKVANDRTAEIKKLLEVKGRLPKGQGTKENLRLELARLYALADVAQIESREELERYIREVDDEIGLRHMPYHGYGGKSHIDLLRHPDRRLFREWTLKQLEEISRVYHQAWEKLYPEAAPTPSAKAEDIPLDVPAMRTTSLTPTQIEKTLALFKEAVAAPNTELQRAAALELRKHVFAQRAKAASESAQAMIAEGMNPEEAIKAAEQMFMSGKLPDLTTDYFSDLTQEMRNVLFAKVYMFWKDKPNGFTEMIATIEAMTNALAGRSIPRKPGTGTQYFPQGGSAWDRLARVFMADREVLEALDRGQSLSSIIETVLLQPGRGSIPLDQATVSWLKSLSEISEEDRILLTKPLSEITETDVKRIAQQWFFERKRQLDRQLQEKVISEQEYKLALAMAKDRVFPHRPIDPAVAYPGGFTGLGEPRLGEIYTPPEQIEETRTERELRLRQQAMEAEKELAEARLAGLKLPFQPVVLDARIDVFEQMPMFTLRERQTINRALKGLGWTVVDMNNLMRGIMASFDASFPRQGKYLMLGHPFIAYRMGIAFWKSLNQAEAEAMQQRIMQDPLMELYEDIRKEYGYDFLRIMGVKKGTQQWRAAEEYGYPTTERLLPRMTQKVTAPFERIFVSPLNVGSWILYKDKYKEVMRYAEKVASGQIKLKEGEGVNIREEMATYQMQIGNLLQRASLGKYNQLGPILNTIFFAARSRLGRFLFPLGLTGVYRRGGEWHFSRGLMKETWRDFMIANAAISGLVLFGDAMEWWEAEKDPRNAEFMSIRIGNMRIDPWAGYRQFVVLYARLATGTGVSSVTGQEYEADPVRTLTTFLRGSLAPVPGILWDFWTGRNFLGVAVELTNAEQWFQRIAPFAVQDIWEAFEEGAREGFISIIPAIFGEGVQTYTGDWREDWQKLGLPKYPENLGYGLEEPYYDLADFWADTAGNFRSVDPAELTASKGFPEYVRSIARALQIIEQIESLPNQRLVLINADPAEGTTFAQYYQMWQTREAIVASGDEEALKEFDADERTSKAYLGNFSQAIYSLLMQYHSLAEDQKAEFLGEHPELYSDPRDDWLRSHPEQNALLALWGKANVYSLDALHQIPSLAKALGIPENAMMEREVDAVTELKIKNDALFELLDVYGGLDNEFRDAEGLTARDRAIERLYEDNPAFRDDMRRIEALRQGTEGQPTPGDIVEGWVERGQIVDEFGANSYEAKLFLIDNSETHQWALGHALLSDDGSDWNEPILRLMVQYSDDFDRYQGYGDAASDHYIMDDDQRGAARRRMLFDENENITSFGRAYYTKDAASQGYSENQWNAYVNYSSLPLWGSWRERFLVDNPGFYGEDVDPEVGNHPLLDTSTIKPLARDRIYQQFYEQFTAWDETGAMTTRAIELMRAQLDTIEKGGITFREARYSVQAYDQGFPEKLIDDYVGWYSVKRKDYEDDWWLMEHQEFYEALFTLGIWTEPRDFSKVPTREVWSLYEAYQMLPPGSARLNYRAEHLALDEWLVLAKGYTPVANRGSAGAAPSPWEDEYRESAIAQDLLERWREGTLVG